MNPIVCGWSDLAHRYPASEAFVGGMSYRVIRYARNSKGDYPGSGNYSTYAVDDVRRLVVRHILRSALGSMNTVQIELNDAIDRAVWIDNYVHIDLGAVQVSVTLPPDVFAEVRA